VDNIQNNPRSKIERLYNAIRAEGTSDSDTSIVLVQLYYLASVLPLEAINHFLVELDTGERTAILKQSLTTEISSSHIWVESFVQRCSLLNSGLLQMLLENMTQEEFPNKQLAQILLDTIQKRRGKSGGCLTGSTTEIAGLCRKIIEKNASPQRSLYVGTAATAQVLTSADSNSLYEQIGSPALHQELSAALFGIAGITLDHRITSQIGVIGQDARNFECGYLADVWGAKQRAPQSIITHFPNLRSEVARLETMLDRVQGRITCVIPAGWLFATAGDDYRFKQYLIKEGLIEAVVQLPERLLSMTSLAPHIVILNTEKRSSTIQFINSSSEEFYRDLTRTERSLTGIDKIVDLYGSQDESIFHTYKTMEELLDNNCNLDVKRNLKSSQMEAVKSLLLDYETETLGDMVDILRCQAIKSISEPSAEHSEFKEVSPANINEYGMITADNDYKLSIVGIGDLNQAEKQRLKANDILFVIKGSVGRCAVVPGDCEGFIANQSFVILRLLPGAPMSPVLLFRYLRSPWGQNLIDNFGSGATVKMMKMADLKKLTVLVPDKKDQDEIEANQKQVEKLIRQKEQLENQISADLNQYWAV